MTLPVITIRPSPGDAATVERAAHQGLAIESYPLFTVAPVPWAVLGAGDFDGVLIGSANTIRHGGAGLSSLTSLPALCVGQSTADAAQAAGFDVIAIGARGMQNLLPHASARGLTRLLRLSGQAHVPLDVPNDLTVETIVLYKVDPIPIPEDLGVKLGDGALVLLHSGEAAAHFASECDRNAISRERIALACLAPRIAEKAGSGWAACEFASEPNDAALLALAAQMCQSGVPRNE